MSDKTHTPLKFENHDGDIISKNSGRKTSSKTPINSGKKDKKAGVNLTPVESLLFFNIVRFNTDPTNVDWVQVAKHSNLKNAGSAKVRFRQIQKKYGLEVSTSSRQMKRKTRATTAEDDDEDDEDDAYSDEHPSKKRSNNSGAHGIASQGRASRKKAALQEDVDDEGSAIAFESTSKSVADPVAYTHQVQNEQHMQYQSDSKIKQESPLCQVQAMEVRPAHCRSPSHHQQQQQQQQQQHGRGKLIFPGGNSTPYDIGSTQSSGPGLNHYFQHTPAMSDSRQSHVFTPQQQAYLQNLQRLHHERTAQHDDYLSPFTQNEPQSHTQAYVTRPGGGLYGQFGGSPTYTQIPQAYFDIRRQANDGVQPLSQAPSQGAAQSRPTSVGDDNSTSSQGDGSFTPAPGSPIQSMSDDMVQVSGCASTDTIGKPASHNKTDQGEEDDFTNEEVYQVKKESH